MTGSAALSLFTERAENGARMIFRYFDGAATDKPAAAVPSAAPSTRKTSPRHGTIRAPRAPPRAITRFNADRAAGATLSRADGLLGASSAPISQSVPVNRRLPMTIDEILADFELLDDWEDRYRYVIELGKRLDQLPEADRTAANKVRGCASQVWLVDPGHRTATACPASISAATATR